MPVRSLFVTVVCLAGLVACGGIPSIFGKKNAKCDLRPKSPQCTDLRDFGGPSLATFQGVCTSLLLAKQVDGGVYEEGSKCDSATALGGCQGASLDGTLQTNWYYQGAKYPTSAEAKAECESNQTWVEPAP